MEQSQKLTFASIFYQNVAGLSADDFPRHRITLQAEDETSCSTSHGLIFLWRRDAEAYAFGVRHVAPSPPGEARAGGAMLRATGMRRQKSFRFHRIRYFLRSDLNSQRFDVNISAFIRNFHQKKFFKFFFTFFSHFFQKFWKIWAELSGTITFRTTYRPRMLIAQNHRLNELVPQIK